MNISVRVTQQRLRVGIPGLKRLIRQVLKKEGAAEQGEIALRVADDRQIQRVNKTYLGKDRPTDVISFNLSEGDKELRADIIVSADTALANSRKYRLSPARELYLYVIHGLLHVLGYDDTTEAQRRKMHKRELQLLRKFRYVR
jgi:probable rRNA maturation factor